LETVSEGASRAAEPTAHAASGDGCSAGGGLPARFLPHSARTRETRGGAASRGHV